MKTGEPFLNLAPQVWKFFIPIALISVVQFFLFPPMGIICGVLALYILYFFRDPVRKAPNFPNGLISPADGKIVSVEEVDNEQMPGGKALRIAIFLSIFNVHVQRASFDGRVIDVKRNPGKFLNALNEKCSEENEQVTIWLKEGKLTYGIRQIAGLIARRIICNVKVGDFLKRGQRYGIIQFGSRVELYMPVGAEVRVEPGQKVRGGETCLAVWDESMLTDRNKGTFVYSTNTNSGSDTPDTSEIAPA